MTPLNKISNFIASKVSLVESTKISSGMGGDIRSVRQSSDELKTLSFKHCGANQRRWSKDQIINV